MARAAGAPLREREASQRPTFLELFFDLVFVLVFGQLSRALFADLTWSGALQALVLLVAMLRVWFGTTWVTNRLDAHLPAVRLLVSATVLGMLLMAAASPNAFGIYGLVFATVRVAVHLGRAAILVVALHGHDLQRIAWQSAVWAGLSSVPWIAGAYTHGAGRILLWLLANLIDYVSYAIDFRLPGAHRLPAWEPPASPEHLAERYQQFIIVALGELILVSGLVLTNHRFTPARVAALVLSTAGIGLLFRIYIHRAGQLQSAAFASRSHIARRWVPYIHIVMIAGIVVVAVADALVITSPGSWMDWAAAFVILGGPALFLIGRGGFEYLVFNRVSWTRPVGVLALVALTPAALHMSRLPATAISVAVLTGVALADTARARTHPGEISRPQAGHPGRSSATEP